ncbi:MAG: hypothetical protein JWN73_995 [Betaproteobacteria bacterium]|nr:hypothetical protein [Betaproteobacteria bacterium]
MPPLVVTSGHIQALRLVDVAYSIDLVAAERLWAAHSLEPAARAQLSATPPKAMNFGVAPLAVGIGPVTLTLATGPVQASATARLYDFGVMGLALKVEADGRDMVGFARLMNDIQCAIGPGAATDQWAALLERLRGVFAPALERPNPAVVEEDYLLGVVHAFDAKPTAAALLQQVDFVPLLSGDYRKLSEAAAADLLRQRFSYYEDDLVILTWDRAFIYEPRGDSDVDDVLEVANAQLLEMRYYDDVLDAELPRMYDAVESTRRVLNVFAARRYATLAQQLNALVAEVTELTEKVDNALQVTEDVYLARVYAAALESFRVRTVHAGVERKLAIIRDNYRALYEEASSSRAELMEITVIVLIAVEVVLAVLRH